MDTMNEIESRVKSLNGRIDYIEDGAIGFVFNGESFDLEADDRGKVWTLTFESGCETPSLKPTGLVKYAHDSTVDSGPGGLVGI